MKPTCQQIHVFKAGSVFFLEARQGSLELQLGYFTRHVPHFWCSHRGEFWLPRQQDSAEFSLISIADDSDRWFPDDLDRIWIAPWFNSGWNNVWKKFLWTYPLNVQWATELVSQRGIWDAFPGLDFPEWWGVDQTIWCQVFDSVCANAYWTTFPPAPDSLHGIINYLLDFFHSCRSMKKRIDHTERYWGDA